MTVIWCMAPQIWSAMDRIFCHFGQFFALLPYPKNQNFEKMTKLSEDIIILHMCNINDNNMMYGSWDTEHNGQNFLSFWTILHPFILLTTQKIKIWKNEKIPTDTIILHMCPINDNQMIYGSWAMERDQQIFLSFWTIFCTFIPLATQKIKILKK